MLRPVTRREFITLLGIAVLWLSSGAAQQSKIPIIGFLTARSRNETADSIAAFREGLGEVGHTEQATLIYNRDSSHCWMKRGGSDHTVIMRGAQMSRFELVAYPKE